LFSALVRLVRWLQWRCQLGVLAGILLQQAFEELLQQVRSH
jgi:hypothetical protein